VLLRGILWLLQRCSFHFPLGLPSPYCSGMSSIYSQTGIIGALNHSFMTPRKSYRDLVAAIP
jgi:hypothetical protein